MIQEEKERIDQLLNNCNKILEETKEMKRCIDFLINEYRTNKRYFREEPGRETTIEDVIKTCFEFGWSSRRIYEVKEMEE